MYQLGLINGMVYRDKDYHRLNVYINDGVIEEVTPHHLDAEEIYDCDNLHIYPGIIDPHTHFNLHLGNMTSQDDFKNGTKAAAFGGVTTIIDFVEPSNSANNLEEAFYQRVLEAKDSCIDYKFHACLKNPKGTVLEIVEKMNELGLNTVKIFTTYSDSNRRTYDEEIIELLLLSSTNDFLVTAHIEADELIILNKEFTYRELPISRPTIAESSEALKLAEYVRETNGNLYMVHCSSGRTLKLLKEKFPDILNKNLLVESCPHYFVFNENILKENQGYLYTMAPPLRSETERKLLEDNIKDIYTIGTDHCSFNMDMKNKEYLNETPLGIGGVEYSFDVLYNIFGEEIIDKMTINVAKAHKLFPQKGIIREGSDADLFVYNFKNKELTENHGNTDYFVYENMQVKGEVVSTISRGKFVIKNRDFVGNKGRLLNKVVKR